MQTFAARPTREKGGGASARNAVGSAARVCAFLFEILRVNRVLSVQIAALGTTMHIGMHVLFYENCTFCDAGG